MNNRAEVSVMSACHSLLDALALPALVLDESGAAITGNEAWYSEFGRAPDGTPAFSNIINEIDVTRVKHLLREAITQAQRVQIDFEVDRKDGSIATVVCSAGPFTDETTGSQRLLCVFNDVTDRRRQEERLAFMAGHDPLTGLPNRRSLMESLDHAAMRARRGGRAAVAMIDMDKLKTFNDARGHLEGDQALVNLAMLIRQHIRAADLPARIGGDEFALLLEDLGEAEAVETLERIRQAAAAEFVQGATEHGLGISVGVAMVEGAIDSRTILDRADAALYAAKARGGDAVVAWSRDIPLPVGSEELAREVRRSLTERDFRLVYQPIVRLTDLSVAYFESFLRLSPDFPGGEAGPSHFLPVVERLGLMNKLTEQTVGMVLEDLKKAPEAVVSLNLSGTDLADAELLDSTSRAISSAPWAHGRLYMELSETALLANLTAGREWMERLAAVGARFVLDDFGTGVGMFVLLRERHIEQVKLSRTVMHALSAEDGNGIFVRALRELIETQGKSAVASFLETDELLNGARSAGFVWGQGYRLHEPQADLATMVKEMAGPLVRVPTR